MTADFYKLKKSIIYDILTYNLFGGGGMQLVAKHFDQLTTTQVYEILKVRTKIFTFEQRIDYLDMDDIDYNSRHFFFEEDKKVTAYLRAYHKNNDESVIYVGRVLSNPHGIGLGTELIKQTIKWIKTNTSCNKICLDSQIGAVGFYEKLGFKTVSDEFLEAGIPHIQMELEI